MRDEKAGKVHHGALVFISRVVTAGPWLLTQTLDPSVADAFLKCGERHPIAGVVFPTLVMLRVLWHQDPFRALHPSARLPFRPVSLFLLFPDCRSTLPRIARDHEERNHFRQDFTSRQHMGNGVLSGFAPKA